MGGAFSRSSRRAYPRAVPRRESEPAAPQEAAPVPAPAPPSDSSSGGQQADAGNQRDRSVEALINRLSGSIQRRSGAPASFKDAPHTLTAQEREANKSGRLAVPHLRALLEEAGAASRAGHEPDVAALAAQYQLDEHLLRSVLRFNKLPARPK